MRSSFGELITEVAEPDAQADVRLGTARWMDAREASSTLRFQPSKSSTRMWPEVWVGESLDGAAMPLGFGNDQHVLLTSGARGGKGAGVIVPTLCLWPGSCIVIDPKGENATVTARRRGKGSEYCHGMGQDVYILDPFNEVQLPDALKAKFNPLDVIDPNSDLAVDDAGRFASAIIVKENKNDPFWEDSARSLLKGLILHVLSHPSFEGARNLITVRRLLVEGDWLATQKLNSEGKPLSTFALLWFAMKQNSAFGGFVRGVGSQFAIMTDKTRSSVLEVARTCTVFLDGEPMRRMLEKSDFDLAAIKSARNGVTIYLTLPQRYMETHFRFLRLVVSLAIGEMERIKGRPATGYPTLFLLDEFAGLKYMEVIENAVAQSAGFGLKFFFVLQNLPQLKKEYEDSWETFMSNTGLKIFFQIEDKFTRDELSTRLGEQEVRRKTRTSSNTTGTSKTTTAGTSKTRGRSVTETITDTITNTFGNTFSFGSGSSRSSGSSQSSTSGGPHSSSTSGTSSNNGSSTNSNFGWNWSKAIGRSTGASTGFNESESESFSTSDTESVSSIFGQNESVHKRPLLNPDEIGRFLSRVDDPNNVAFPGLAVALIPGQHPVLARRINYFNSRWFEGLFDPHPNYPPPLTLKERAAKKLLARGSNLKAELFLQDQEEIETWLKMQTRQVCNVIAARAALRMLPLVVCAGGDNEGYLNPNPYPPMSEAEKSMSYQYIFENISFLCFLCAAQARVAGKYPGVIEDLRPDLAYKATMAATPPAVRAAYVHAHAWGDAAQARVKGAAGAARAAAQTIYASPFEFALYAAGVCAAFDDYANFTHNRYGGAGLSSDCVAIRRAISVDAHFITMGGSPNTLADHPLWPKPTRFQKWMGTLFREDYERGFMRFRVETLHTKLHSIDKHWDVWTNWYEDIVLGRSHGEAHDLIFAIIPEGLWGNIHDANRWVSSHIPK